MISFDVEGRVTGFGNPDWLRTHLAATSTAPAVSSLLEAGATALGITIMDEMAYRFNSTSFLVCRDFENVQTRTSNSTMDRLKY